MEQVMLREHFPEPGKYLPDHRRLFQNQGKHFSNPGKPSRKEMKCCKLLEL